MSTTYQLLEDHTHNNFMLELTVTECSAKYYIEMDRLDKVTGEWDGERSTSKLPPEKVLGVALRMICAVWCQYPDTVDVFINSIHQDLIGMVNNHDKFLEHLRRETQ